MLRRPPTTITLTHDDIAAYEDSRHARDQARAAAAAAAAASSSQQQDSQHGSGGGSGHTGGNASGNASTDDASRRGNQLDPSDELRPFPSDRARGIRQPAGVTATPTGPSTATAAGSPRAPARTRDERIGLTR